MALFIIAEIQFVNDIDDLAQQNAVLHIVVGIGESGLHDGFFDRRGGVHRKMLQGRKQGVVHEIQQALAGHGPAGTVIMRPAGPAAGLGDDGHIIVLGPFPVLFLGIIDLEKQHPGNLFNALGIAVDAGIVAHDVAQAFNKTG